MAFRDVVIGLSENELLNASAQKYGLKLGAQSVVAGTNIEELIASIQELNTQGISATINHLGEFIVTEEEATTAKHDILTALDALHESGVDAHLSIKLSQLGLDVDIDFCYDNLYEIIERANDYGIFVNIDTETFERLQISFDMLEELSKTFENVGTVIQAYFLRAQEDIEKFANFRLRIVKGAYKESEVVAYQDKLDIDINYMTLVEFHLLHGKFTSIATHDHSIIANIKRFVEENNIPRDKFEFQVMYGFRKELQQQLTSEGYNLCVYTPYGQDWYGYFMRRLAERPQNLQLVTKQVFNKKTNTVLAVAAGAFVLGRLLAKKK